MRGTKSGKLEKPDTDATYTPRTTARVPAFAVAIVMSMACHLARVFCLAGLLAGGPPYRPLEGSCADDVFLEGQRMDGFGVMAGLQIVHT